MAMHVTDVTLALLGVPPTDVTGDVGRAAAELRSFVIDPVAPSWLLRGGRF
jgi:hypothetical protein